MPELPEVETLKRGLLEKIKGKTISRVEIIDYKNADGKIKEHSLAKIVNVRRRAKILIIDLANHYSLIIHVKLTGYFYFQPKCKNLVDKFTHVIFHFSDGSALLFEDVRKFGWIKIMKTAKVEPFMEREFCFGPEPLEKEFTLEKFKEILEKKPKAKIKPLLMDPSFVAGIGNIYAQESCYEAGILPVRRVQALTEKEIKKLYEAIIRILKHSVEKKGTSAENYVTVEGKKGGFEPLLKVYQREKDPKGHHLTRMVLAGRGTNYCKICQK